VALRRSLADVVGGVDERDPGRRRREPPGDGAADDAAADDEDVVAPGLAAGHGAPSIPVRRPSRRGAGGEAGRRRRRRSGAYGAATNFLLNTGNTGTAQTSLDGTAVAGKAALRLVNTNTATGSTALNLSVAGGHPPFSVSAGAGKVVNLNADKLDGVDSSG